MQDLKGDVNAAKPEVLPSSSIPSRESPSTHLSLELSTPTSDIHQGYPSSTIDERALVDCECSPAEAISKNIGIEGRDENVSAGDDATQNTSPGDFDHAGTSENARSPNQDPSAQREQSLQERRSYHFLTSLLQKTVRQSPSKSSGSVPYIADRLSVASVVDPSLLGPNQCSAIVVNYISAGYILLPFAFSQAGYVYSAILFGFVSLQSHITSLFILETCARAETIKWISPDGDLPSTYSMAIRETKYELSSLQQRFLGHKWTRFFLCTTACDLYGITWLVASIFGQALAEQVSITGVDEDYKIWVGVFMAVTVPLSCTSILDQALLQFIFLGGRMFMILLMMGTIIVAMIHSDQAYFGDQIGPVRDTPIVDWTHTITIIQTAIFSTSFQFSVPGMAGVSNNKKSMTGIFRNAVAFVYGSNCALALLMALYFGSNTNPSSNLNWSEYHSGNNGLSSFVSGYVVLFAAIDGLAVYPLMCCSLGDILLAWVFGDKAPMVESDRKTRIFFRVMASLPQCMGALFVRDLGVLAKYGGLFTIISYIFAPSLLYLASGRAMKKQDWPTTTYYSSQWFSQDWLAYTILTTTALIVVGVVLDSIFHSE